MTWTIQPRSRTAAGLTYLERPGPGPAVLLLHGVGLRAEAWALQLEALAGSAHLFALDLPGHGDSDLLASEAPSVADYCQALEGFLERTIGGPSIIAGHSLGGLLTLELAARRPDLTLGLAALNTVFQRSEEASAAVRARARELLDGGGEDIASAPLARWFGANPQGADLEAAEACRGWLETCNRPGYARAYRMFAESDGPRAEAVAGLAMPALFLTGAGDPNSTPAMSEHLAALAPEGQCCVIQDAAHMAQMTHAEAVNRALSSLLSACAKEPLAQGMGTGR